MVFFVTKKYTKINFLQFREQETSIEMKEIFIKKSNKSV